MLVKIDSEAVVKNWSNIRQALEHSVDENDDMDQIFFSLLTDRLTCWIGLDDDKNICGVLTTTFMDNVCNKRKSLWIYSIYSFKKVTDTMWLDGYGTLSKYARARGCDKIMAISNVEVIKKVVNKIGGDTSSTLINLPLL